MEGQSKRGAALTVFALQFLLLAIEDVLKPFSAQPEKPGALFKAGIVFLGTRFEGTPAQIIGPLLAIFLLVYTAGIWQMRRYALYMAYGFAIYVALNLFLFFVKNPPPATRGQIIFDVAYVAIAVVLTWTPAILIGRRLAALT
jgi:hypothetical protein